MRSLPCLLLVLTLFAVDARAHEVDSDGPLRIFTWGGYFSDTVLARFTADSGVPTALLTFVNEQRRDERMLGSLPPDFDIVVVDSDTLPSYAQGGVVLSLAGRLDDAYARIDSRFRRACGDHGLPYLWGTLGFAYRSDLITEGPGTWREFFELPGRYPSRVVLEDSAASLVGSALLALGHHFATEERAELLDAYQLLSRVAPDLMHFGYSLNIRRRPDNLQQLVALSLYGGDFLIIETELPGDWQFVYPRDGVPLWVDCLAIVTTSERPDAALSLLRFLTRPEQAAQTVIDTEFPATVDGYLPLLPEALRDNPLIFPPGDLAAPMIPYRALESLEAIRLRHQIRYTVTMHRHED